MNKADLSKKKIAELRVLAKSKGVRNIIKLKKSELIAKILSREKSAAPAKRKTSIRKTTPPKIATTAPKSTKPAKRAVKIAAPKITTRVRGTTTSPSQVSNLKSQTSNLQSEIKQPSDKQELVAHKFDLEPVPTPQTFAPDDENLGELPEAYGTQKLFLTARDPHWLFAYWDMTSQQMTDARNASRDHRLVLRVFESNNPFPAHEIHLHHDTRNWYLHVGRSGATWRAQLGYFRHDGAFHVISESGRATTPRDFLGSRASQRFVTIPADWSLRQLFELVRGHKRAEEKLADVLHRLQMAGFPFPFEVAITASEWTLEQERALYALLGGDNVRRIRVGSLDFSEWLRRKLLEEISSSSAASLAMAR
jgi:hypothetical protein